MIRLLWMLVVDLKGMDVIMKLIIAHERKTNCAIIFNISDLFLNHNSLEHVLAVHITYLYSPYQALYTMVTKYERELAEFYHHFQILWFPHINLSKNIYLSTNT